MFIKMEKYFRGGKREEIVWLGEDLSEDEITEIVDSWGENSPGGYNYGYTLRWERVETTKELLLRERDKLENKQGRAGRNYAKEVEDIERRRKQIEKEMDNV